MKNCSIAEAAWQPTFHSTKINLKLISFPGIKDFVMKIILPYAFPCYFMNNKWDFGSLLKFIEVSWSMKYILLLLQLLVNFPRILWVLRILCDFKILWVSWVSWEFEVFWGFFAAKKIVILDFLNVGDFFVVALSAILCCARKFRVLQSFWQIWFVKIVFICIFK